tara:strand:+ start:4545 stop:4790 length:246 start_codon:yes stop_codon:yes gene_type:complete
MPDDEQLSRALFLATIEPIKDQIDELVTHHRAMNGRIRQAETKLAVLNDRSPNRVGLVAGSTVAAIAGCVFAALQFFSTLP